MHLSMRTLTGSGSAEVDSNAILQPAHTRLEECATFTKTGIGLQIAKAQVAPDLKDCYSLNKKE
jgi:hypothetical protein